jgi:hypothetical protein
MKGYYMKTNKKFNRLMALSLILASTAAFFAIKSGKTIEAAEADGEEGINLSLNVYYNDAAAKYYSNEHGPVINITADGQYTLSFDCTTDLSDTAKAAGVASLRNLTAVYIKDQDVTDGKVTVSDVESADIMFDRVTVDGKDLTITQTEPKSAIKDSGVFDTNDPLNSWDGSQVSEVNVYDHVLNIVGFTDPKKIEVTFTISNMKFKNPSDDNTSDETQAALTSQAVQETQEETAEQTVEQTKQAVTNSQAAKSKENASKAPAVVLIIVIGLVALVLGYFAGKKIYADRKNGK